MAPKDQETAIEGRSVSLKMNIGLQGLDAGFLYTLKDTVSIIDKTIWIYKNLNLLVRKRRHLHVATKALRVYTVNKKQNEEAPLMADVEKLRKVKQCIDSLAEGLNPFTGQPLPEEDIVNDVRVSRSLFLASAFL